MAYAHPMDNRQIRSVSFEQAGQIGFGHMAHVCEKARSVVRHSEIVYVMQRYTIWE